MKSSYLSQSGFASVCLLVASGVVLLCGCGKSAPAPDQQEAALRMARAYVWQTISDDARQPGMTKPAEPGTNAPADFKVNGVSFNEYESRVQLRKTDGSRVAWVEFRIPGRITRWPREGEMPPPYPFYLAVPIALDPRTGQATGVHGPR